MPEPTAMQVHIDSTLDEQRSFEPPAEFSQKAQIKNLAEYEALYKESIEQPEKFWARAAEELHWFKKWDKVLEWKAPWAKWFVGGEINLSYNCLHRHVQTALCSCAPLEDFGVIAKLKEQDEV
jgi:acetyl-CoA synthetase